MFANTVADPNVTWGEPFNASSPSGYAGTQAPALPIPQATLWNAEPICISTS